MPLIEGPADHILYKPRRRSRIAAGLGGLRPTLQPEGGMSSGALDLRSKMAAVEAEGGGGLVRRPQPAQPPVTQPPALTPLLPPIAGALRRQPLRRPLGKPRRRPIY